MKRYLLTIATVLLLGIAGTVNAQQAPDQPREVEPGVGRISFIHGDVSTQRGDSGDLTAGTLNTPIVSGDRILTGMRSRAEVQLDYANILRMADNSTANIVNLSRTQIQIQAGLGLMTYDVLKGSEADVEIDTPATGRGELPDHSELRRRDDRRRARRFRGGLHPSGQYARGQE
jgi:hypothetical protein